MKSILPIVEGEGDKSAVPLLIRKILAAHKLHDINVLTPQRRGDFPKVSRYFDDYFQVAIKEKAPILWVLDYDCEQCDCPKRDAEKLQKRGWEINPNILFKVAFMVKEFESLFLCDIEAVAQVFADVNRQDLHTNRPEAVRGAKEKISSARPKGFAYKETIHQAKIVDKLNFATLRLHSPSFVHLEKAILYLVEKQH